MGLKLFLNYKNRKYQDTMMQVMEDLNIETDDMSVCDGDFATVRVGGKGSRKPPTDVIIELNPQSQRHLFKKQQQEQQQQEKQNGHFTIDDDDDVDDEIIGSNKGGNNNNVKTKHVIEGDIQIYLKKIIHL